MMKRRAKAKSGIACIEFAVTLPLLVLVVLSSLALCNFLSVQQASSRIAFDVCRGIESDGLTVTKAEELAVERITALGFDGTAVVTDDEFSSRTKLCTVRLMVSSKLLRILSFLPSLKNVTAESSILRRY